MFDGSTIEYVCLQNFLFSFLPNLIICISVVENLLLKSPNKCIRSKYNKLCQSRGILVILFSNILVLFFFNSSNYV